ncbi:hypothetical protein [Rhizobium sp. SYY.PMSO]|uniref:hypothetical protein n=1 Tax=Rhizobium sp. SYY.PMSO TaxID=3382192 RepID=UPI0039903242
MYLRDSYFKAIDRWPTVDLLDGYFTILCRQTNEEVNPALRREIFRLQSSNKFEYFYKGEETFNGVVNTGPSDNWLEIAWCEAAGVAAILYRGEGIPSRVLWFDASSPEEAIDQWCEEYVVPTPVTQAEDGGDSQPPAPLHGKSTQGSGNAERGARARHRREVVPLRFERNTLMSAPTAGKEGK